MKAVATALPRRDRLRLAVGRALARPALRTRARELARWAADHDGPTRAAELVEAFARQAPGR